MRFRLWSVFPLSRAQKLKNGSAGVLGRRLQLEALEERLNLNAPALFSVAGNLRAPMNLGSVVSPAAIITGDFNKDGIPDLATANPFRNSISIMMGQGKGAFAAAVNITVNGNPQAILAADLNNDGFIDLATANYKTDTISVLLGNGNGSFKAPQNGTLPAGAGPRHLIAGDFNRDGLSDIATANFENQSVSMLLGQGHGKFSGPQSFLVGDNPAALALGDFNRDGKLDLASANAGSKNLSLLLGDGVGGFTAGATLAAGSDPESIAAADFDRDGITDLAVADPANNLVWTLLGDGLGGFGSASSFATGTQPLALQVGEFNGDKILDIATVNASGKSLSLLFGQGDGGFQAPLDFDAASNPVALTAGDFNGDGLLDLVAANNPGNQISLINNSYFPSSANFTVNQASRFAFQATGSPAPVYQIASGSLPQGLSLDPLTGILSGAPAAGTHGTYSLIVSASNGVGDPANLDFTLNVRQSPNITSAASAIFRAGESQSFAFSAEGFPLPTFAITAGILPHGLTFDAATGVLSGTPAPGSGSVRDLVVSASNGTAPDATQVFHLAVEEAASITSAASTTFTYGQTGSFKITAAGYPAPILSVDSLPAGISFDPVTGLLSGKAAAAGSYFFSVDASNGIGSDAMQSFQLTVDAATLTVTPENKATGYGGRLPLLTASMEGFVNGDGPDAVSGLEFATSALLSSPVGNYTITASGGEAANYKFVYKEGTLTISPAVLTVTLENKTKVYGAALPALTVKITGFVNDEKASLVTGLKVSTLATASSGAGNFAIVGSGAQAANYTFQYVPGTLTVTKALLTITAENKTKIYGAKLPDYTVQYAGLVNGDTASVVSGLSFQATASTASPVGQYAIVPIGALAANYSFQFAEATLTVTRAPLTIVADDKVRLAGEANPIFSAQYKGLVNNDITAVVTGLVFQTTATKASPAGKYPIVPSNGIAANYNITFVHGTLSINEPAKFTSATSGSFVYGKSASFSFTASGQPVPSFSVAKNELPAGVEFNAATGALSTKGSIVPGTYKLNVSASNGLSAPITQAFTLVVNKAALQIKVDDKSRIYAAANPTLTVTYTGFIAGDGPASVTGLVLNVAATNASFPGDYPITASGASSPFYNIEYVQGKLSVTRKKLEVNLANLTKNYGSTFNLNPQVNAPANQAGSAYFSQAIDITKFSSSFTFKTLALSSTPGDGFTFIVQGNGTAALGTNGEGLGFQGIGKSVAIKFDFFNNGGEGDISTGIYLNGARPTTPSVSLVGSPIDLRSDRAFLAELTYDGSVLKVKVTDTVSGLSAAQSYLVDIATQVGGSNAFVGFTAATGALVSRQSILSWDWTNRDGAKRFSFATMEGAKELIVNGSAILNGPALIMTGFGTAGKVATGVGDESLSYALYGSGGDAQSHAGDYPLQGYLVGANAAFYELDLKGLKLVVKKAALLVKPKDAFKVYGDTPTLSDKEFSVDGTLFNGDMVSSVVITSEATKANANAGTHPIVAVEAKGKGLENYEIVMGSGSFLVNKAQLTITADYKTKIYGAPLPALTASYLGFLAGDGPSAVSGLVLTTNATATSEIGDYKISAKGATATNYIITLGGDGTLTVNRATLTITADSKTKVYGAAIPTLTSTMIGLVAGDSPSLIKGLALSTVAQANSGVGTFKITPSSAVGPKNYSIVFVEGTLTITKAALTVSADPKTKTYGAALPALTATFQGLVNGDTATALTGLTLTTVATPNSPIGDYAIIGKGLNAPNYDVTYVPGNLKVAKATLKITPNNISKIYGQSVAFAGTEFTASGLVAGDRLDKVKLTTAASAASALVGTYNIQPSQEQGVGLGNYDIVYNAGVLTVNRAALTITADNSKKVYGQANPAFTARYAGFVNGDGPASVFNLKVTSSAGNSSPAGTYPIAPSGAESANYVISFVNGQLTVDKAALTIVADNKSRAYGAASPAFTATYQGLILGDTATSVSGLSLTSVATSASAVGSYEIVASKAVSSNYTIAYVSGLLAVTKARLTISADNKTKTYGAALPDWTPSFSGLVNGDTAAVVSGLSLSSTATASSPVGSYSIALTAGAAGNYDIQLKAGSLTVTPATLTITADNKTRYYGGSNPALTASFAGLVLGDSPSVVSGLQLTTPASNASKVGSYAILASGGTAANYTIKLANASLTVTPAPLTITADAKTKTYGAAMPPLTVTYSGLVHGETSSVVAGLKLSTTATKTSKVGDYAITLTGGASANYAIRLEQGKLAVTKALLTITADNKSRKADTDNPAFTATIAGLVNGDTKAVVTGLGFVTEATKNSVTGVYAITPKANVNSNYEIALRAGSLTVFKAPTFSGPASVQLAAKSTLTYAFAVTGFPDPQFSISKGSLPTGVTLNPVTGVLNLSPATRAGIYRFTIKAANLGGAVTQDFVLTLVS